MSVCPWNGMSYMQTTNSVGVSQSMLNAVQSCERKFKYCFVDKLQPEMPSGAMEFGTALHTAISSVLDGEGDPLEIFQMHWDSVKDTEMQYYRNDWEAYNRLGPVYLERFKKLHAKNYELMYAEERISATFNDTVFEGTPDFVGKYKGLVSLLDFKTASKPYEKLKLITSTQLHLYAWLAMEKYGIQIEQIGYVVFVSHPEPRIQVLTEKLDYKKMEDILLASSKWARRINSIHNGAEAVMNVSACGAPYECSFIKQCWGNLV